MISVVTSLSHFNPSTPLSSANWYGGHPANQHPGIIVASHTIIARGRTDMSEMKEFAGVYYREGALDAKTLQLVALAAMAAAGCTS